MFFIPDVFRNSNFNLSFTPRNRTNTLDDPVTEVKHDFRFFITKLTYIPLGIEE